MWKNWKVAEENWVKLKYSLQNIANCDVTAIICESVMLPELELYQYIGIIHNWCRLWDNR